MPDSGLCYGKVFMLAAMGALLVSCALPAPSATTGPSAQATVTPQKARESAAPSPQAQEVTTPATEATGEASFTGQHSDTGYDADGNGLFDHLRVDIELNVTRAGSFGITPVLLTSTGELVASGDLYAGFDRQAPVLSTTLSTGSQIVSIYFSGRAIRDSGADGPYSVRVTLTDDAGNSLAAADFTTGAYDHLQFQGLLPEVQRISDSGVDTDSVSGYNLLRVTLHVNMLAAGDVAVQGQLFAGDTYLADAAVTANLGAGPQTLNLDFPGGAIAAGGLDGPYMVYLTVYDGTYTTNPEHTTSAYRHTAFQP
jgi:hypothetical protein